MNGQEWVVEEPKPLKGHLLRCARLMAVTAGGSGLLIDCIVFSTDGQLDHGHPLVIRLAECIAAAKWPAGWIKEGRGSGLIRL